MTRVIGLVAVGLVACDPWPWEPSRPNPLYCDATTTCADPARPFCDAVAHECKAAGDGGVVDMTPTGCKAASECGADKPVCEAGSCRACAGAADDAVCLSRSAAAPRCQASSGKCVACRADTEPQDCTAARTPVCDSASSTCRACRDHADCRSGACLLDGSCAPAGMVAWVDNRGMTVADCNTSNPGATGTKDKPWCEIKQALGHTQPYIVIAATAAPYGVVTVSSDTWTLLGPLTTGAMQPQIAAFDKMSSIIINPTNTANLTLVAIDVSSAAMGKPGINCAPTGSASLTILRSSVHNNDGVGISASNCTVTVDSSNIYKNGGGGIKIDGGMYTITNSFITGNGTSGRGVSIGDSATGVFAFNTVVGNFTAVGAGGVGCGGGTPKVILDSIVAGNAMPGGSQFFGNCTLTNVVTGVGDSAGGVAKPPAFVNEATADYHLLPNDAKNGECCIDRVVADPGTPNENHDVDSNVRPKGAGWDIGAHEAR